MTKRKSPQSGFGAVFDFVSRSVWALQEDVLGRLSDIVMRHVRGERVAPELVSELTAARDSSATVSGDYQVIDGVAVIPISGVIAKHASQVQNISGPSGTAIEDLQAQLRSALADSEVKAILFDVDSPGGSVDGVPTFAEEIRAARGQKPMVAFSNDLMASAAYWLASQADSIVGTRESLTGSIGVYSVVEDLSRRAAMVGVDVNVVKAGRHKGAGVPGSRMDMAEVLKTVQERVDQYYQMFVDAVAAGRGVTHEQALALADGRVHIGEQAVQLGLVDAVSTFDEVLAGLASSSSGHGATGPARSAAAIAASSTEPVGGIDMTPTPQGASPAPAAATPGGAATTVAAPALTLESLRTQHADLAATLVAEGKTAGIAQERGRVTELAESCPDMHRDLLLSLVKDGATVTDGLKRILADDRRMKAEVLKGLQEKTDAALGTSPEAPLAKKDNPESLTAEERHAREFRANKAHRANFNSEKEFVQFRMLQDSGQIRVTIPGKES